MNATTTRARRADAERNIAAIIEAAIATFGRDPDASMADVAAAAGVGRVTLYAHFPNRQALIEATLDHVLSQGRAALRPLTSTTGRLPTRSPAPSSRPGPPRPTFALRGRQGRRLRAAPPAARAFLARSRPSSNADAAKGHFAPTSRAGSSPPTTRWSTGPDERCRGPPHPADAPACCATLPRRSLRRRPRALGTLGVPACRRRCDADAMPTPAAARVSRTPPRSPFAESTLPDDRETCAQIQTGGSRRSADAGRRYRR